MTTIMPKIFRAKRRKTESFSGELSEASSSLSIMTSTSGVTHSAVHALSMTSLENPHHHNTENGSTHRHRRPSGNGSLTRKRKDEDFDPNLRPPKFRNRSPYSQSSAVLATPDIRMILIEAESRVLFDTATVIPVRNGLHPSARSMSACGEFQFLRRKKDTVKLSQMIFGAVPSLKGSDSFRIHVLEDEEKILVSRTFAIPKINRRRAYDPTSSDSDSQSTVKSLDRWRTKSSKSIMTTPEGFSRIRQRSMTFCDEDNEVNFDSSSSTFSLPKAFSPPHRISKTRRRQLAATTSLSEVSAIPIPSGSKMRSRMSSLCSSQNDDEQSLFSPQKMRNLALGILVPIRQRSFLMQHIPLIESEMSRFESRIVTAASYPPTFLFNVSKSWEELTEVFCQLHNAPRLQHPYWLALNEKCMLDEKTLAMEFCGQLAYLVRRYDRKETGYFLSNLVTAILMHHMSWVASVASPPVGHVDTKKESSMEIRKGEMKGAITVGYNAHMAQYLEISGSCGIVKSAKICILGEDVDVLASVCSVLSFFIRCSAVQHIDNDDMWEVPTEHSFSPVDMSTHSSRHLDPLSDLPLKPAQQHFAPLKLEETSSVAMMRRLRNNNQASTPPPDEGSKSDELSIDGCQATTLIDRLGFPCCPTISKIDEMWIPRQSSEGLGSSMFAGPLEQYCSHFVLSALMKSKANLPEVFSRMCNEVQCCDSNSHRASTMPPASSSRSSVSASDSILPENIIIVADIEDLSVRVLSSEGSDEVTSPSESVVAMLEQFVGIHDAVPATAEFLVGFIEDSLAHIVGKSLTLVELVRADQTKQANSNRLTPDRVRSIIGCDHSDLRLIINVAAVYWPPVLQSVLG